MMPSDETLFLCATSRLAQTLRARPSASPVWRTPQALTPAQWLGKLADEATLSGLADLPQVLDPFAEKLLWEQVIADSLPDAATPLFDLSGMAASALEAHALTRSWQLLPAKSPNLSDEAQLFLKWQTAFLQRSRNKGWIDLAGMHLLVLELLQAGHFKLPPRIEFAGFDRYTPFEKRFMEVLAGRGVLLESGPLEIAQLSTTTETKAGPGVDRRNTRKIACADSHAEGAAMVAWAKTQLAENPLRRLAVVAPDLKSVRDHLEFLLEDVLHPAALRPDAAEIPRCYNFSLGRALADLPLVRTALEWLALATARGKMEQTRLSGLLLGGAWSAAATEADGRARLDVAMRRDLGYFTTLPALIRLARRLEGQGAALCPLSVAHLEGFVERLASVPARRQLPGLWRPVFLDLLQAIGWPGERTLSSHEFQARRTLLAELDGLAQLDAVLGPISLAEAVRRLAQRCRQRIFQPETRGQPALQILGVLESAGLQFDALWVMGMNDDVWPPAPRPNPLLPIEMLRAAGAPHASAEVELDFASRVQARLLGAAPEITFSYATADGNRSLRPSPLIATIALASVEPDVIETLAAQWAANAATACELLDDAQAPALLEGEKVSGGSWLLRAQAICPAWGFYQYRLGAEAMETPVEGLDPAARGTLVHAALEAFWRAVGDSAGLARLVDAGLPQAIETAVNLALSEFESERHITLPVRFRQLEGQRLQRLLSAWLAVESRREQGFSVLACEQPAEIEIEQIRVKMVVDRIDQLADGRRVIIDYKTGVAIDIKNWAEDRLTEPQLPIYAALVATMNATAGPGVDAVAAVVFAKVLLDKPGFSGVAEEKNLLPGVQGIGDEKQRIFDPQFFPDWPSVIAHWQKALRHVAQEIRAGVASVNFSDVERLKYCEVKPLLRLAERARFLEKAMAEGAK